MCDIADFENILCLDNPIKSSTVTRWERKAKQTNRPLHQRGVLSHHSELGDSIGEPMDRYIPNRSGMDFDLSQHALNEENHFGVESDKSDYSKLLHENNGVNPPARVLAFKNKAPAPKEEHLNTLKVLYTVQGTKKCDAVKSVRHISSAPVRILDAPEILDDYYLNLMSWGSTNVLAIALSQTLYLWDASTSSIKELMSLDSPDDYISSVSWIQQGGSHIAVGTASNSVQLWDVQAGKQVRSMEGHSSRVGALAWNNHMLASGSRDTTIINHDVRIQNHIIGKMNQHSQEVCGLAWSPDGSYLASGANDNTLCIFDATSTLSMNAQAKFTLTDHQAAVKALAWSPHERNLLASGGGTADRTIKFWNASSGALINSIDTGSQVCALQWSPHEKEILSSHGYAENQLCLWKYPTMAKMKELKGHTSRVLHLATSPDGNLVCSGAADETLRFWNVFSSDNKRKSESTSTIQGLSRSSKLCLR
eukprot:gene18874-24664_t